MTRTYRITHHTTYAYDDDVTDSYGLVLSRPRDLPDQVIREHRVWTEPGSSDLATHHDVEGNLATYFHITEPHRRLTVSALTLVDCLDPLAAVAEAAKAMPWEQAVPAQRSDLPEAALVAEYAVPSPLVDVTPEITAYAATTLTPGRPLWDAVTELVARIHRDFEYEPGSTDVTTRVGEVLRKKAGVCQDFAHLLIACLRSHGLAARYVSGYLSTDPPAGKDRVVGADATHAWVHCWYPDLRQQSQVGAATPANSSEHWLSVDPTNDLVTGDRHVTVAWGRDYADVPPVKGVIFTDATESTMTVSVDVAPAG